MARRREKESAKAQSKSAKGRSCQVAICAGEAERHRVSTDARGDDDDISIYDFVAGMEGMTCSSGSGYGSDDNCNEPNRADPADCDPDDEDIPGSFQTGNRDSYNVKDFATDDNILPGSQVNERTLNCVQNADD